MIEEEIDLMNLEIMIEEDQDMMIEEIIIEEEIDTILEIQEILEILEDQICTMLFL